MSVMASTLKSRNKAQAELKFACLKLRKSLGGVRKLEDVSVEEWEASGKSTQRIADVLQNGDVDASVVRSYVVQELVTEIKSKVVPFVGGLESVIDRVNEFDASRFQIGEILDLARVLLENIASSGKELEKIFERESNVRKDWEGKNPRLAEQERELRIYERTLRELLLRKESPNKLQNGEWIQAEGCLSSLEPYLLEHKIDAQRIEETKFEELLRELLGRFEKLDEGGIDKSSLDVARAERVWGLIDKLGSGVAWLMRSERLRTAGEPVGIFTISSEYFLIFTETYNTIRISAQVRPTSQDDLQHEQDRVARERTRSFPRPHLQYYSQ